MLAGEPEGKEASMADGDHKEQHEAQHDHTALMDQVMAACVDSSEGSITTFYKLLGQAARTLTPQEWKTLNDRLDVLLLQEIKTITLRQQRRLSTKGMYN